MGGAKSGLQERAWVGGGGFGSEKKDRKEGDRGRLRAVVHQGAPLYIIRSISQSQRLRCSSAMLYQPPPFPQRTALRKPFTFFLWCEELNVVRRLSLHIKIEIPQLSDGCDSSRIVTESWCRNCPAATKVNSSALLLTFSSFFFGAVTKGRTRRITWERCASSLRKDIGKKD